MRCIGVALAAWILIGTAVVLAQVCGDATGDNQITVTDGIAALRTAAELSGGCDNNRACDVNGDQRVTLSDGVAILRVAAELSTESQLHCLGVPISELIENVTLVRPITAAGILDVGVAPIPPQGAPDAISASRERSAAVSNFQVSASQSFILDFIRQPGGISITDPVLVVSAQDSLGNDFRGFFEIPLDVTLLGRDALFEVRFAPTSVGSTVTLRFGVQSPALGISQYVNATQVTGVGFLIICGNGVLEPPEQCDPQDTFFLSDDAPPCGGSQCTSSCTCAP